VLGYPDVFTAGDHVTDILPLKPTALEGMDHLLFEFEKEKGRKEKNLELMPHGKGFLLVEFGGDSKEDADAQTIRCMEMLKKQANPPTMKMFDDPEEEELIWKIREGGLGATAWVPGRPDSWPGWEDSAVPPEKVGNYLRDLRKLYSKYNYHPSLYGHLGQGCIHCRVGFDPYTQEGIENWRNFLEEAVEVVVSYGGSMSGEHGDGQASGEFLPKMFGETLYQAFREFKSIWDPQGKMNPGKKIDAYGVHGEPAHRGRLQPAAAGNALPLPRRQGIVRTGGPALRRRRRMPQTGRRGHVPQLSGHTRGEGQHTRPGAPLVRDDERRGADRRLEE
jgi:FAD/FMN-containing dehydrogenase